MGHGSRTRIVTSSETSLLAVGYSGSNDGDGTAVMQNSPGVMRIVEQTATLTLTDPLGLAPVPPEAAACIVRSLICSQYQSFSFKSRFFFAMSWTPLSF